MTYYRFQGSTLTITDGTTSTTVHTAIGGFLGITHSPGEANDVDRTNAASTRRRYKQGLGDGGNVSFDLQLDPEDPGQAQLEIARSTGAVRQLKWTLPGGNFTTWNVYVKSIGKNAETEGDLTGTCNCRVTGASTRG